MNIDEVLEELETWWDSETDEFRELILGLLAALPGGEELEDLCEPLPVGWKEVELLGKLCAVLNDAGDVRRAVRKLLHEGRCDEEEET